MTHGDVPASYIFWFGATAGMVSATCTHSLDVGKIHRQISADQVSIWRRRPAGFSWFRGVSFGTLAQATRFATTIYIDADLQNGLRSKLPNAAASTYLLPVLSFGVSMFSAGLGELIANPPVAAKNFQIAQGIGPVAAVTRMYSERGYRAFFRGVSAGLVRKSLANALVLQTISPTRSWLATLPCCDRMSKETKAATVGLLAGALVGGVSEVLTNPIDIVKTKMQAEPTLGLRGAISQAWKSPLRGAGYAFARKGSIRALNWGVLGLLCAMYERQTVNQADALFRINWVDEKVEKQSAPDGEKEECVMTQVVMPVCV